MLRLKGQVVRGELEGDVIRFDIGQICGIFRDGIGTLVRFTEQYEVFVIDPATIQPINDPRKAMLDEIRKKLGYVQMVEDKVNGWGGYSEDEVDAILDEMEAKL